METTQVHGRQEVSSSRNFQQVRIGVNANFKSDLIYVNLTILFAY